LSLPLAKQIEWRAHGLPMTITPWFPTLIYSRVLGGRGASAFNRELLKECHLIRRNDADGQRWSRKNYPGGYTSYGSLDKLHKMSSTFMELERRLTRCARAFARELEMDLGKTEIRMTDCWVNIMPRQCAHSLHLHPLSIISGTYYVRTPKGCSRLKFEDPRLDKFMAAPPRDKDCKPANRQFVSYPVEAGQVILFESWLRHEVAANPSAMERVSISFNFDWL
jgi:uncharacterized protein (TIGR02466 family)